MDDFLNKEHIMSPDCWCRPVLDSKDPVTGVEIWIHNDESN